MEENYEVIETESNEVTENNGLKLALACVAIGAAGYKGISFAVKKVKQHIADRRAVNEYLDELEAEETEEKEKTEK